MNTARCLSDDVLLALTGGDLSARALDAAQTHLDSCRGCRRLLVALSRADTETRTTRDSRDERDDGGLLDLPVGNGTRIGRYVVTGVIGAGGMGAVYAADDVERGRRAAIKLVHRRVDRPEVRLRREAAALSSVVHPNVVRLYEVGAEGPRTYLAMELIDGTTLRSWLLRSPRSVAQVVAAFEEAGRGLEAAHAAGLLHCDFKPDNVFVGGDGRVKLGDFGLARPAHGTEASSRGRAPGETISDASGTPAYLAPEVIAGAAPSFASDQFSFCVSLWEALHGVRPFPAATGPSPEDGQVRAARPAMVPEWLRRVLLRGLAPRPAARHRSMKALLRRLAAGLRFSLQLTGRAAGETRGC